MAKHVSDKPRMMNRTWLKAIVWHIVTMEVQILPYVPFATSGRSATTSKWITISHWKCWTKIHIRGRERVCVIAYQHFPFCEKFTKVLKQIKGMWDGHLGAVDVVQKVHLDRQERHPNHPSWFLSCRPKCARAPKTRNQLDACPASHGAPRTEWVSPIVFMPKRMARSGRFLLSEMERSDNLYSYPIPLLVRCVGSLDFATFFSELYAGSEYCSVKLPRKVAIIPPLHHILSFSISTQCFFGWIRSRELSPDGGPHTKEGIW